MVIFPHQVNNIPGIEEVNMIRDDGTVIHFNNPKVQASLAANTFAVTGHGENKQITELLPGILNQLGTESLTHLKKLASNVAGVDRPGLFTLMFLAMCYLYGALCLPRLLRARASYRQACYLPKKDSLN